MGTREQLWDLKIRCAQERCQALAAGIAGLQSRIQTTPAAGTVIRAINDAVQALQQYLGDLLHSPDLDLLTETELEAKIHFAARNLPVLYRLLGLVEHSDVSAVPAELIVPLRRELQNLFPDAELLVVASPTLNYSVLELSQYLRRIFENLNHAIPKYLPESVFRASIPSVEYDQGLLHCILAHEIGHPLYDLHHIEDKVMPISIEATHLQEAYHQAQREFAEQIAPGAQKQFPFDELRFKRYVTWTVNEMLPNWVQELAADLFGFMLFGPAYLFAFIHFSQSFALLDSASTSHPPDRERIRAMFRMLDRMYSADVFSQATREFLDLWRQIASRENADVQGVYEGVALKAIRDARVSDRLIDAVMAAMRPEQCYNAQRYRDDCGALGELIDAQIPPAEVMDPATGQTRAATITGILNAGWDRFLSGLLRFKEQVRDGSGMAPFDLTLRFNRFLLKSMELNDAVIAWGKAKDDIINRQSAGPDAECSYSPR